MKLIKSLLCGCLCVNNIYKINKINKIGIDKFKKVLPNKYPSFRKTKEFYFNNNIYYDIYKDNPYYDNKKNINIKYNENYDLKEKNREIKKNKKIIALNDINKNQYIKYNDLTAEHIVPQSFIKEYPKAKFDMHNIYLTEAKINCNRSNYKYKDESEFIFIKNNITYIKYTNNEPEIFDSCKNYKNNKLRIFIPYKYSRGSIARTIIYMKYTYENLIIDNVIDIDTLIKWNEIYPPNKMEIEQNELIYKIQGNYNIFILHPHLVEEYTNTLYK